MLRFVLIGTGVSLVISGAVGLMASEQLIEPADEAALGITRREFLLSYGIVLLAGLVLTWLGFRRRG